MMMKLSMGIMMVFVPFMVVMSVTKVAMCVKRRDANGYVSIMMVVTV